MRKNEEEQGARLVHAMTRVILGGAVGLVFCLVFLFACSFGISAGLFKESIMYQLVMIGCVLGGLLAGMFAVRRYRSRRLIIGLAAGAVFFLLLLTAGVLFYDSVAPDEGGVGLLCSALCGGAAAGILGGRSKRKRR